MCRPVSAQSDNISFSISNSISEIHFAVLLWKLCFAKRCKKILNSSKKTNVSIEIFSMLYFVIKRPFVLAVNRESVSFYWILQAIILYRVVQITSVIIKHSLKRCCIKVPTVFGLYVANFVIKNKEETLLNFWDTHENTFRPRLISPETHSYIDLLCWELYGLNYVANYRSILIFNTISNRKTKR